MTCDNNRPCERCVSRGLADTCRDGVRKKAKYLADVPDAVAVSDESLKYDPRYAKLKKLKGKAKAKPKEGSAAQALVSEPADQVPVAEPDAVKPYGPSFVTPPLPLPALADDKLHNKNLTESSSPYEFLNEAHNAPSHGGTRDITREIELEPGQQFARNSVTSAPVPNNFYSTPPPHGTTNNGRPLIDTMGLQPSRHNFQSMAVNMEYSIISNILTSANQYNTNVGHSDMTAGSSISPSLNSTNGDDSPRPKLDLHQQQQQHKHHHLHPHTHHFHGNQLNQFSLGADGAEPTQNLSQVLETVEQLNKQCQNSHEWGHQETKRPLSFTISSATNEQEPGGGRHRGSSGSSSNGGNGGGSSMSSNYPWQYKEPADIYANVRQPFSYTPAYHQLTIYIRTRFKREQQMRIARCMASYRPSFIACTNTLKEDDLIFMEQCFQRTLLEYEKFISYSGTPTMVWRRTGQVAAVGKEFCILTGWPRERLLNEHTFVVELMDDSSALEYFEMFSKMAFGDSRGANMTECTLLTPQGQKIKTSSIWTLKRDVFGIPMMIVGNFLPILP